MRVTTRGEWDGSDKMQRVSKDSVSQSVLLLQSSEADFWSIAGEGGVGGDWRREVISPCIRAQFKQTSVGAVTVRGRNALPVSATLPSVICGSTVTIWLMMARSLPTFWVAPSVSLGEIDPIFSLPEVITSRSHWVGIMNYNIIMIYCLVTGNYQSVWYLAAAVIYNAS